jgi:hypothetical protein
MKSLPCTKWSTSADTLFYTPGVDYNFSHLTFETMAVIGYLFRHQKLIDQSNHFTLGSFNSEQEFHTLNLNKIIK